MALPQGNIIVEAPHTTTVEQGGPSSHMQPIHETILARDTSTPPLQVVSPTVPSRASTRSKSKNAPQINLGPVAPFVANLRGQALPRQSTTSLGPRRLMLSRDVEGAPTKNTNNGNKRLPPVCVLRWARRPREDRPKRGVTKQTKQIKSATGPTQDKTKTKKFVEFGYGHSDSDDSDSDDSDSDDSDSDDSDSDDSDSDDSDDSDAELSGENDDTSHAEALSDSTYCKGD
jgi:hypothetical protein